MRAILSFTTAPCWSHTKIASTEAKESAHVVETKVNEGTEHIPRTYVYGMLSVISNSGSPVPPGAGSAGRERIKGAQDTRARAEMCVSHSACVLSPA